MSDPRNYEDEDVRSILDRALAEPADAAAGLSHEQLLAVASEIGLSRDAIDRAARAVSESRLDAQALRAIRRARRRPLAAHALAFSALNAALFTVNALSTPGEWWVLFSIFFWGLLLSLHAGLALGLPISAARLARERRKLESASPPPARLRVATPPHQAEAAEGQADSAPSRRTRGAEDG